MCVCSQFGLSMSRFWWILILHQKSLHDFLVSISRVLFSLWLFGHWRNTGHRSEVCVVTFRLLLECQSLQCLRKLCQLNFNDQTSVPCNFMQIHHAFGPWFLSNTRKIDGFSKKSYFSKFIKLTCKPPAELSLTSWLRSLYIFV